MSTPSAFEMGRQIGGNIGGAITRGSELGGMDQILSEVDKLTSPQEKQQAMSAILQRVSPENRQEALQVMQQKLSQIDQAKTQEAMVQIADQIELNNPDSGPHKMIADVYRSDLPIKVKEQITKSISNTIPFKYGQQARLERDSKAKNYNALIKETTKDIENLIGGNDNTEFERLEKRRKALRKARDETVNLEGLKLKEDKPKFDYKNPKHIKRRKELLKKYKNDQSKVNKIMMKEFSE